MGLFKQGSGGFLNNVTGVIVGYKFDSKVWESKKKGGDDYTTFSMQLDIQQDGVPVVQQFLPAGFLHDGEAISKDGRTLEAEGDAALIDGTSETAKFIQSLIDAGFDGSTFDENGRNFDSMIGARVTFVKVVDKAATEKFGKRIAKSGKSKGKGFDRDYLAVKEYHGQVEVKKGKAAATSAKTTTTAPKAAAPKAAEAEEVDDTIAVKCLLTILKKATDNTVPKGQLNSAVVKFALANDIEGDDREELRNLVVSDAFLATEQGWTVNAKAKTISLG